MSHVREIPAERQARAPYNFVPLPERALPAPSPAPDACWFDPERYTGALMLTVEARTPIFIGHKTGVKEHDPAFFAPGGVKTIPGSTLRGMARTLLEIVSHGKLQWTSERRLFSRAVADPTRLGANYRGKLVGSTGYRASGGWVYRQAGGYVIRPARRVGPNKLQVYRIHTNDAQRGLGAGVPTWSRTPIFFKPGGFQNGYGRVRDCRRLDDPPGGSERWERGTLIRGGPMPSVRLLWIVVDPVDDEHVGDREDDIQVLRDDELAYLRDLERAGSAGGEDRSVLEARFSVLPGKELAPDETRLRLPCFYLVEPPDAAGNRQVFFGHTGMFRLPYDHRLVDAVPPEVGQAADCDLAEAIFGVARDSVDGSFAGRVFFEDAPCTAPGQPEAPGQRRPLMEPKPTAVQHYVVQEQAGREQLRSWDDVAPPRGHKLYWHRPPAWRQPPPAPNQHPNPDLTPEIRPLGMGAKFQARVRFENLTEVELGALLFALDLPPECAHKLGMGKPLGLGSVRIESRLRCEARGERYAELFDRDTQGYRWHAPTRQEVSVESLKNAFADWVFRETGGATGEVEGVPAWKRLWQTWRLRELYALLTYEATLRPPAEATASMPDPMSGALPRYRDRPVLPRASVVMLQATRNRRLAGEAGPTLSPPSPPAAAAEPRDAALEQAFRWAFRQTPHPEQFEQAGFKASVRYPGEGAIVLVERPDLCQDLSGTLERNLRSKLKMGTKERLLVVRWLPDPSATIAGYLQPRLGYEPPITLKGDLARVALQKQSDGDRVRGPMGLYLRLLAAALRLRQIELATP